MTLSEILDGHRLVLCVGSGGVGKTTTAAALGEAGVRPSSPSIPRSACATRSVWATSTAARGVSRCPAVMHGSTPCCST